MLVVHKNLPLADLKGRPALALALALLLASLVIIVGGGLLNRLRGGWHNTSFDNGDERNPQTVTGVLFYHAAGRWLVGLYNGIVVFFLCTYERYNWVKRISFSCTVAVLFALSYYADWHSYDSVGAVPIDNGGLEIAGLFDWLLGSPTPQWRFWRRFARDYSGLSLRGLMQTATPGLLFYLRGYGWELMACGLSMGTIYAIGRSSPFVAPFGAGTQFGELLWGMFSTAVILFACFNFWRAGGARILDSVKRPNECMLVVGTGRILALLFLISTLWFAVRFAHDRTVAPSYGQTVLGGMWASVSLIVLLVLWEMHSRGRNLSLFAARTRAPAEAVRSPLLPDRNHRRAVNFFDSIEPVNDSEPLFSTVRDERTASAVRGVSLYDTMGSDVQVVAAEVKGAASWQAMTVRDVCRMEAWLYGTHALRVWLLLSALYGLVVLCVAVARA